MHKRLIDRRRETEDVAVPLPYFERNFSGERHHSEAPLRSKTRRDGDVSGPIRMRVAVLVQRFPLSRSIHIEASSRHHRHSEDIFEVGENPIGQDTPRIGFPVRRPVFDLFGFPYDLGQHAFWKESSDVSSLAPQDPVHVREGV